MSRIAVAQVPCRQVEHTEEECHEHTRFVAATGRFVDGLHDTGGIALTGREGTEQRMDDGHDHCRRRTLATDVTDAEEQLLVTDVVVVEVAAHFTGWFQKASHLQLLTSHLFFRQHALLNLAGHVKFTVNTFLLQISLVQLTVVSGKATDNQGKYEQTHNHENPCGPSHRIQFGINLLVVAHQGNLPFGISLEIGIEYHALIAIRVFDGE